LEDEKHKIKVTVYSLTAEKIIKFVPMLYFNNQPVM